MRPARSLAVIGILVMLVLSTGIAGATYSPRAIDRLGHYTTFPTQAYQFGNAGGIAADPNGTFWVADRDRDRVVNVTAAGAVIRFIGGTGTANSRMSMPNGVCVAPDKWGNTTVYVADTGNDRIQVFDERGNFLRKFGTRGSGDGQFDYPIDLEYAPDNDNGTLYVVDNGNYRVQRVDALTGAFVDKVGGYGTGDGQFQTPVAIALTGDRVFVTDYQADRFQMFDIGLTYLQKHGVEGFADVNLNFPTGIDATGSSTSTMTVWIVDAGDSCVKRFTFNSMLGSFDFTDKFGMLATGSDTSWNAGRLWRARDIALPYPQYGGTTLMVADEMGLRPYSYVAPARPTTLTTQFLPNATAKVYQPEAVAVGSGGVIWASSARTSGDDQARVLKYTNPAGRLTPAVPARITKYGPTNNVFYNITDMDCDASGNLYVLDRDNYKVIKFDSAGNYVWHWGAVGAANGAFGSPGPSGLDVIDTAGTKRVYVADRGNHRVQYFDLNGVYQGQFGNVNTTGQVDDVAATDTSIFTIEQQDGASEVRRFTASFVLDGASTAQPGGADWIMDAQEIAVDKLGGVYVLDSGTGKVHKFNNTLEWLGASGSAGTGTGQTAHPGGLAVDSAGTVFVADTGNHRIQQWRPLTKTTTKVGTTNAYPAYGGATTIGLYLMDADGVRIFGEAMKYYVSYDGKTWTQRGSAPSELEPSIYFPGVTRKVWVRATKVNDGNDFYAAPSSMTSVLIKPKVKLSNPVAPTSAKRGVSFTVYGYLEPKHTAGASSVRVNKYRKSGSSWVYVGYTYAKNYTSGSRTRYSVSTKIGTAGTYKLVAYAPSDSGHAATSSPGYDTIVIK